MFFTLWYAGTSCRRLDNCAPDRAKELVIGFVGCQIDSVFGATLETRGWLTKKTNNLLTVSVGAVLAWFVLHSNFFDWLMSLSF